MTAAVIRAADAVRREFWRAAVKTRLGRACARDRATRLATLAVGHILVALLLTGLFPMWLLLVGPLVLGVPHVIGDVRFLVLNPPRGVRPQLAAAVLVPLGAMTAVRVATVLGYGHWPLLEVSFGAVGVFLAIIVARGSAAARLLASLGAAGLTVMALQRPLVAALVLAHVHNVVGLGLWLYLACRQPDQGRNGLYWGVLGVWVLAAAVIMGGGLDHLVWRTLSWGPAGLTFDEMVLTLAPGLAPVTAIRLVLLFAFAQAVHYAVWVRLMPGTAPWAPRPATPTVKRALSDLSGDLGPLGLVLGLGAMALVLLGGLVDPVGTRATYLSLVLFHGWLEIAVVAHLLANRT